MQEQNNNIQNVFILSTGRCGSTTFIRAAEHMTNFTAGHETRTNLVGAARLAYPPGHIEADNRLTWLTGRLDKVWGDNAHYVHLSRNPDALLGSLLDRYDWGIMKAYRREILMRGAKNREATPEEFCYDYINTVTQNIELFLRNKSHVSIMQLENMEEQFPEFWSNIGAEGDLSAAMQEWRVKHNARTKKDPVTKLISYAKQKVTRS